MLPSINKSKFKKWLKNAAKTSPIFYKENEFIGSLSVIIRLNTIENLDELKPSIVELFGHLEGDWIHATDGFVYDYKEMNLQLIYDELSMYDEDVELGDEVSDTGFRTKKGSWIYDDLSVIPDGLELHDYHHTYVNERSVTIMNIRDEQVIMCIEDVTRITGNDIDIEFVKRLEDAYHEAADDEGTGDK